MMKGVATFMLGLLKSENRINLILACLLLCCLLPVAAFGGASGDKPRIAVGYSTQMFVDIDVKDAAAATKIWTSEVGAQAGLQPENHMYDDAQKLIYDFNKGVLDIATFPVLAYFRNESALQGDPAFIGVKNGKATQRYIIVVSADNRDVSIKALKGSRLAITQNDTMSSLYLNIVLLRQHQPEMDQFFSAVLNKPKPSQAINAVYFGSADICVTTEQAFQTMTEMNPQVGRKLRIISTSPGLLQGISLYRNEYPKALRKRIETVVYNMKNYPRGKQVLTLFQCDDLAIPGSNDLIATRQLYLEYRRLKGKLL